MTKKTEFTRGQWAFVFVCEAILIGVLIGLIVLFSSPAERKLMDTVRTLYHAKHVKEYSQYKYGENTFTFRNVLQERQKIEKDLRAEDLHEGSYRFYYSNAETTSSGTTWILEITSDHFDSHKHAREVFNEFVTPEQLLPYGDDAQMETRTYDSSRILEITCAFEENGRQVYEYYTMYIESKSIVFIYFRTTGEPDKESEKVLSDLCYELSIPDPQELWD